MALLAVVCATNTKKNLRQATNKLRSHLKSKTKRLQNRQELKQLIKCQTERDKAKVRSNNWAR